MRTVAGLSRAALCIALCLASTQALAQTCPGDADLDGEVTIAEVQQSANSFLNGCRDRPSRFFDNGDGTIFDYATGLMWEKKVDLDNQPIACASTSRCPDPHDADNRYTWSTGEPYGADGTAYTMFLQQLNGSCDEDSTTPCASHSDCAGIGNGLCGFAGYSDWRLPTREELVSIMNYAETVAPIVDPVFDSACTGSCTRGTCSCTSSNWYSSASTVAINPGYAWTVAFFNGSMDVLNKTDDYHVRAVRAGW